MTDKDPQPSIILARPQLGENIGKAARAMLNFALTDMRLVAPRDGWPNPAAGPAAAGADAVLAQARCYDRLEDALADCTRVFAATIRPRDMHKAVVTPEEAARQTRAEIAAGGRVGLLFGSERAGLDNDEVALADTIMTVPVNPAFGSLNLAQAVIIFAYEWFRQSDETPAEQAYSQEPPATKDDLQGLYDHVEQSLDACGYFRSDNRRAVQVRSLRALWQNARFNVQEVRTLRGVVKSLARGRIDR